MSAIQQDVAAPVGSNLDIEAQSPQKPLTLKTLSPQHAAIVAEKKQANPAPLGLFAFALTTMMLMYVEAEWAEPGFVEVVVCTAIFFGGAVQIMAGMWEMARGSTFAATAFSSYGGFWLGWAFLRVLKLAGFTFGPTTEGYETAEALYLGTWGLFSFLMSLLLFGKPWALRLTFYILTLAFFLLVIGEFHEHAKQAGGYVGLVCAAGAAYTAFSEMVEETYHFKMPLM
ncbi:GPR1/FUN34/yaaH family-domain-containing protein [Tribonema minus]|uniref:GPR1/FUN34/yaaH family-domain-containing protein n=1 Tax=Tribonema minus TaxID=303371 RepID=A0A835ZDQ2_9STRA|nr:GPR1/FUN34/yaaH family-domain-containing protein [Tribonema minus]